MKKWDMPIWRGQGGGPGATMERPGEGGKGSGAILGCNHKAM